MENKIEIFSVATDNEGHYQVTVNENTSVEEVAFAMTVVIKCFHRDEVIDKDDMMSLIEKYLNDVQYEEVQS